uniref:NADH-ubiquinone oxidoreductase chain 4 n=1 Tax=Dugesia japonica TaxID=6161 RepID=G9M8V0_DUGJA|nr:NADH dehydrogenase subunit 4 [Dugesia japonica]
MLSLILLVAFSFLILDYLYLIYLFIFCLVYLVGFLNFSYLVIWLYKFPSFCVTDIGYYFIFLLIVLFVCLFVLGFFNTSLVFLLFVVFFVFLHFFMSINVLYMFLYFEFSFVVIYLFVVLWGYNPERLESLSYFLIYSVCGSFPLFGVVSIFIFYVGSSFCFDCIFQLLLAGSFFYSFSSYSWFFSIYSLIVILGFFFKFPIWGFHSWLPKVHVEAPYFGSVLLAGLMVKLGLYGIYFFYSFFLFFNLVFLFFCFLISYLCVSLIISNFCTVRQLDIKSYIAYSSIVHMGLVAISFWSGSLFSVVGSLLLSVSHGFVSSSLFISTNFFYFFSGTRNLYLNRGYLYSYSVFVFFWFLFLVINSSIPFSLGFFSELSLVYVAVNSLFFSSFFVCFNLFFCGLYCIYLYIVVSHGFSFFSSSLGSFGFSSLYFSFLLLIFFNYFFVLFLMIFCSIT